MKKIATVGLLIGLFPLIFAQKAPMKYGKVSMEEMTLKYYQKDSSVNAAVLCEYGVFNPEKFEFTLNIRYKIFHKEGLNALILALPVKSKNMIKGCVFNLEDGKIVESKLGKESIYEERLFESYTQMRFAPPDAKEGSVVDIKATMRGLPSSWKFQKEVPVMWSELIIPYSEYVVYNQRFIGYEPLDVTSSTRWVAKDMPAFHSEPFINSKNNFMTTMYIELSEIHIPAGTNHNGFYKSYANSWEDVNDLYMESEGYGDLLNGPAVYLNEAAEYVESISETEEEKVVNALTSIREDILWNKKERLWPTKSIRNVYVKEKTGNSADMNFLFLKLLSKLDVEGAPMIISTREEGMVNPHFPSASRFNYTISYVKIGDRYVCIDAADKYYPYDLLNEKCLNGSGFVLRKEKGEWIDLVVDKNETKIINCNLTLSEDGIIEGNMLVQYANYASSEFRKSYEQYTTEDAYLESFEQDHPNLMVLDYKVENLENNQGSIKETFQIEIDGNSGSSGNTVYLDPVVIEKMAENPFKLEQRNYPVDYGYPRNKMYVLSLTLPDGYEVEQLPSSVHYCTQDKSGVFKYKAVHSGNAIQIMYQMSIKKPLFLQNEYDELRSFYNLIVSKESEPVIIKEAQP